MATVIQTVQPDIVVLELCKDRTNILHLDEETVLEEAKNLTMDKMLLAIRQNGTIQVFKHNVNLNNPILFGWVNRSLGCG